MALTRDSIHNMLSADTNPQVVADYVHASRSGSGQSPKAGSVTGVQVSPCGVIPKGHAPGKWRLIVDLSSPQGASVNDGIPREACSVTYIT